MRARIVPALGLFDLDHRRPEVAQHHGGQRARKHAAEVGDDEPRQGACCVETRILGCVPPRRSPQNSMSW